VETIRQVGEVSEVGGLDDFALDDREHDFNLVQPGSVHWQMNESGVRERRGHPLDCRFPMRDEPSSTTQYRSRGWVMTLSTGFTNGKPARPPKPPRPLAGIVLPPSPGVGAE
jgi:hypothetical protein